jgi:hypothetical protein
LFESIGIGLGYISEGNSRADQGRITDTPRRGRRLKKTRLILLGRGRNPRTILFSKEEIKLPSPIWTSVIPEVKRKKVNITGKGSAVNHRETHMLGGDKELKRALGKLGDTEVRRRTANGGLENDTNRA